MKSRGQLESMLEQAQAALTCPVCHRQFERTELRLRGMLEKHGIVQAACSDKHNPAVVIFIADQQAGGSSHANQQPLTTTDVLELHRTLETFDGNFRKHLKPQR